jgi:hypothetical protein
MPLSTDQHACKTSAEYDTRRPSAHASTAELMLGRAHEELSKACSVAYHCRSACVRPACIGVCSHVFFIVTWKSARRAEVGLQWWSAILEELVCNLNECVFL